MPPKASRPPHPWPLLPGGISIVGATWDPTPMGSIEQFMPTARPFNNMDQAKTLFKATDYEKWKNNTQNVETNDTENGRPSARMNQSMSNPTAKIRATDEALATTGQVQIKDSMEATEPKAGPTTDGATSTVVQPAATVAEAGTATSETSEHGSNP